jgi:hypothetical protein
MLRGPSFSPVFAVGKAGDYTQRIAFRSTGRPELPLPHGCPPRLPPGRGAQALADPIQTVAALDSGRCADGAHAGETLDVSKLQHPPSTFVHYNDAPQQADIKFATMRANVT